jgi:hypothetical protein
MSIASSHYAEYANKVKDEWVRKLKDSLDPLGQFFKETAQLEEVIKEIENFKFGE